jgi:glutathione S-transferase
MLTLYDDVFSPYARKVRIALYEKNLPFEGVRALHGDCNRTDFVHVNPRAEVPALVQGEATVYDSTVICEYLEDRCPEPSIYPHDPQLRAECRLIEDLADTQLDAAMYAVAIVEHGRRESYPAMHEAAGRDLQRLYDELERRDRPFFCGVFSLADIAVAPHLMARARNHGHSLPQTNIAGENCTTKQSSPGGQGSGGSMPHGVPELLAMSTHTPVVAPTTGEKQRPLPQLPQAVPTGEQVTSGWVVVVVVVGTTVVVVVVVVETGHGPGPGQHVTSPVGPTHRHSCTQTPLTQASEVHGLPSSHPPGQAHAPTHAAKSAAHVLLSCWAAAAHPRRQPGWSDAVRQPRTQVRALARTPCAHAARSRPQLSKKAPVQDPVGGSGGHDPRQSSWVLVQTSVALPNWSMQSRLQAPRLAAATVARQSCLQASAATRAV